MAMFDLLTGISPWWWVALALALGAVELVTFTYFLLWLALAALSVAVALWVGPGLSGQGQALVFSVLAVAYTVAGWMIVARVRGPKAEVGGLNQRAARMVGRQAVVSQGFEAGFGSAELDGVPWRARLADPGADAPALGSLVTVAAVEGATLVVAARV